MCCTTHWLKCLHERISRHLHGHTRCAVVRSLTLCSSLCFFPCVSPFSFFFFFYLNPELNLFLHVVVVGAIYHGHSAKWGVWPLGENTPLTGYEPNIPDDFHYSDTTEIFFYEQSSDGVPSYLFDAELDDGGPKTSFSLFWRKFVAGKPALDLWDLIVAVLHGNTYQSNQARWDLCTNLREVRAAPHKLQQRKKSHGMIAKQLSRWSYREEARQCRVALDWLFDGINLDPRFKSNTLTPKTNLPTYWQREISHVMDGIIFCVCSTLGISVPPIVLK